MGGIHRPPGRGAAPGLVALDGRQRRPRGHPPGPGMAPRRRRPRSPDVRRWHGHAAGGPGQGLVRNGGVAAGAAPGQGHRPATRARVRRRDLARLERVGRALGAPARRDEEGGVVGNAGHRERPGRGGLAGPARRGRPVPGPPALGQRPRRQPVQPGLDHRRGPARCRAAGSPARGRHRVVADRPAGAADRRAPWQRRGPPPRSRSSFLRVGRARVRRAGDGLRGDRRLAGAGRLRCRPAAPRRPAGWRRRHLDGRRRAVRLGRPGTDGDVPAGDGAILPACPVGRDRRRCVAAARYRRQAAACPPARERVSGERVRPVSRGPDTSGRAEGRFRRGPGLLRTRHRPGAGFVRHRPGQRPRPHHAARLGRRAALGGTARRVARAPVRRIADRPDERACVARGHRPGGGQARRRARSAPFRHLPRPDRSRPPGRPAERQHRVGTAELDPRDPGTVRGAARLRSAALASGPGGIRGGRRGIIGPVPVRLPAHRQRSSGERVLRHHRRDRPLPWAHLLCGGTRRPSPAARRRPGHARPCGRAHGGDVALRPGFRPAQPRPTSPTCGAHPPWPTSTASRGPARNR